MRKKGIFRLIPKQPNTAGKKRMWACFIWLFQTLVSKTEVVFLIALRVFMESYVIVLIRVDTEWLERSLLPALYTVYIRKKTRDV